VLLLRDFEDGEAGAEGGDLCLRSQLGRSGLEVGKRPMLCAPVLRDDGQAGRVGRRLAAGFAGIHFGVSFAARAALAMSALLIRLSAGCRSPATISSA